jgi:CheY-like chemotaxis protein/HPt (histidine-containing phosphotransfer) domain-containing protein
VLVADDSESYRRITRGQLAARGLDAVTVSGGREALAGLAAEPFDLLLIDGMMPGLDGIATAREIRRREAAAGVAAIAIVAISASGRPEDRDRMLAAGIDDLVVKPILDDDLERALARWLPPTAAPRTEVIPALPAEDGALVDEAAFSRLASLGDPPFVERMVGLFLADAEGRVSQVEAAAAAGDLARARVALEALQSIASTVGATALGRHALAIEDAVRSGDGDGHGGGTATQLAAGSDGLETDLAATRDRLRELLGELRGAAAR